ncbi:MAG TPA: hypothetical protein DCZ59_07005 [Bacteroidetes bacterium]|nr:hypothetical protein [Bacteroidota bacterium]
MIDLLIYHIHVVAAIYAFTARWQRDGLKGGFLAVATCALVFTILWAMTGPIARIIMPGASEPGALFTSDTLSLTLLLIPEAFFFRSFFLRASDTSGRDVRGLAGQP